MKNRLEIYIPLFLVILSILQYTFVPSVRSFSFIQAFGIFAMGYLMRYWEEQRHKK